MKRKAFKPIFLSAIFIGLIIGSLIFFRLLFIYQEASQVDLHNINLYETTEIYDQDDNLITTLGIEKRECVEYDEISKNMIDAIVSIEDRKYFEHNGVDVKRMVSALYDNLKSKSYKEGASTITQQLIKLEFLTTDKTLERKITEIFLSFRMEKMYSKEDILTTYLNRVLFGGRIYGVEKASQYYFNKSASNLDYEEAALLAGIIQIPNLYNPYTNEELTKNRQIDVLNAMYQNDKISKDELEAGINRPLNELVIEQKPDSEQNLYNEYIDYVIHEIKTLYGLDPFNDSLTIYTNIDQNAQNYVTSLENNDDLFFDENLQTAMVVIETGTGKIKAIGGGRNYQNSLQFSLATDALLQPGSTIKPLLDYGPAIEYLNYAPGTMFVDEKIYYSTLGSRYMPVENYDHKYKGTMTMREALIDSRNVPAIKVFREVGQELAYQFASQLGLTLDDYQTESNAIGGFAHGFSVLEMAGAYAPFGNNGFYNKPTTIDRIYHENEEITIKSEAEKVMRDETAYLMSDILHDNMIHGTAYRANVSNLYLAGKTGQTNFDSRTQERFDIPSNAVRDSWFIGYSKEYTTAVWVGYDQIDKDLYLTPLEAKLSLDLFRKVMSEIHHGPTQAFERPETIVESQIELGTTPTMKPGIHTPSSFKRTELFIEGFEPQEYSTKFNPLRAPNDFFVYFDDEQEQVVVSWNKPDYDYNTNDFSLMGRVHSINKYYDYQKDLLLYEYYHKKEVFPSYIKNDSMIAKINRYCASMQSKVNLCINQESLSYDEHILLLNELNQFETNEITAERENLKLLNEAEISDMKTVQQKLGNIVYTIKFKDGLKENLVYTGPYQDQLTLNMSLEEFLTYDSFTISADYSRYKQRLSSNELSVLNPFYSI